MVSKVRNFWLCVFSGVVATTLIEITYENIKKFVSHLRSVKFIKKCFKCPKKPINECTKKIVNVMRFQIIKKTQNFKKALTGDARPRFFESCFARGAGAARAKQ